MKKKMSDHTKCCVDCKATKTPLWRIGPAGPRSLCNACGIRYRKRKTASESTNHQTPSPNNEGTRFHHISSENYDHHHHYQLPTITSYNSPSYRSPTSQPVDHSSSLLDCDREEEEEFKVPPPQPLVEFEKNKFNKNSSSSDDDDDETRQKRRRRRIELHRFRRREHRRRKRKMGEVEEAAVMLMSLSYGTALFAQMLN